MIDRKDVREVELAFLNAPFSVDGWLLAVRRMAELTGSSYGQLLGIGGPGLLPLNVLSSEPSDRNGHLRNPELHGPQNWRVSVTRSVMNIYHEKHYHQHRQTIETSLYDDACSDLGIPYGCQSALLLDSGGLVGLAVLRSPREGRCSTDDLEVFSLIADQAQRAMRVQLALGHETADLMLSGDVTQTEATLLLDRFGNLAGITPLAEDLFDQPFGLRLDGLALHLANTDEDRNFSSALHRLLQGSGLDAPVLHQTRFGRSFDHPQGRWRLVIARLPASLHGFDFNPALALTVRPI